MTTVPLSQIPRIPYTELQERFEKGESLDALDIGEEGVIVTYPFASIFTTRSESGYTFSFAHHNQTPKWSTVNERIIGGGEVAAKEMVKAAGKYTERPTGMPWAEYVREGLKDLSTEQATSALNLVGQLFVNTPAYTTRIETQLAEAAAKRAERFRS